MPALDAGKMLKSQWNPVQQATAMNTTVTLPTRVRPKLFGRLIGFGNISSFEMMFVVLGGLPLFLPFILFLGESGLAQQQPIYWYFWVNAIVSMPHTCATYCRLDRKIREGKTSWWFGIPMYVGIVIALSLLTVGGYFLVTMTAVNVWQSYHYVRQVYGVSSLYAGDIKTNPADRSQFFWAYHLAMPLFILGRWDVLYTVWNGVPSDAIIPVRIPIVLIAACVLLAAFGFWRGIGLEVKRFKENQTQFDCTPLIALVTYYFIHYYGFLSVANFQRGFMTVTIFHAIQYIALVWLFESRHRSKTQLSTTFYQKLPQLASFGLFWALLFVAGSIFQDHLLTMGNVFWLKFSTICLSAISVHHYAVDSVMWGRKSGG